MIERWAGGVNSISRTRQVGDVRNRKRRASPRSAGLDHLLRGDAGLLRPCRHRRGREARREDRELDARVPRLGLRGLGQRVDAGLRRRVERHARRAALGRQRRDVDDERLAVLVAGLGQHRQRGADGEEHRAQVDLEVAVEHLGRHPRQRHASGAVGRRVDERVHAAVGAGVGLDQPRDRLLVGDVRGHRLDRTAPGPQLAGRGRELGLVSPGDRQPVALLAEDARERLADAAGPAGDESRPWRHGRRD